jgi:hypothetical protein
MLTQHWLRTSQQRLLRICYAVVGVLCSHLGCLARLVVCCLQEVELAHGITFLMYIEVQQLQNTWTLICPACRQQAAYTVSFLLDAHGRGCDNDHDNVAPQHRGCSGAPSPLPRPAP